MNAKDGEIFPPTVQSRREPQLASVSAPELGGLLTKWHYHFQKQTADKQTALFNALESLFESQQRAIKANVSLEISLVRLEFLEDYKKAERERIRAELIIRSNAVASELLNSGVDLLMLIRAAKEKIDPTPTTPKPSEPRKDPKAEKVKNTMNGGGYYTKMAEDLEAELIKKRGGKHNLDQEDIDRIKNAFRQAAQFDEGQG